jgi:hypothetical protein
VTKVGSKIAPRPDRLIGPKQPPAYGSDELGAALKAADVAWKAGQQEFPKTLTPEAYQKLCSLAEAVTFVEGPANDSQLENRREGARHMAMRIATTAVSFHDTGRLAGELLRNPSPAGGIVLAGKVTMAGSKGGLHAATVQIGGRTKVVVMSDQPLGLEKDDLVVVLGSIIPEPAKNLAGYTGSQPLVVWSGAVAKCPQ